MRSNILFPADLADFLFWVKTTTEKAWSEVSSEEDVRNAKWLGLSDQQIDDLEKKYSIKFGYEHRAFLKILHTVDKHPCDFYNWLTDAGGIESRLNWPYQTILHDVLGVNKFWLKSWGPRVDSEEERIRMFSEWYNKAPKLLPITAHTFLMDNTGSAGLSPLLSVWGSDTIVKGWSLRHFLMREFADELNLSELVLDEEDNCYYRQMVVGVPELDELETIQMADANIPYWKEVIDYWLPKWPGIRAK